jgi:hypothetical protein
MQPKIEVTNKEALLTLLRSGEPYVVECEVSASSTVSYFYRKDSEEAVAKVVVEGKHIGAFTNLSQRMTCEDETAIPELQRLESEMRQMQSAH